MNIEVRIYSSLRYLFFFKNKSLLFFRSLRYSVAEREPDLARGHPSPRAEKTGDAEREDVDQAEDQL